MKSNIQFLVAALSLFFSFFSPIDALAIDQVTLNSGELLEGKILSDVPHQHVDIQLVNGTKKRIQRSDVKNVERDVPSDRDFNLRGSDSPGYFGLLIGEGYNLDVDQKSVQLNLGFRVGVNANQIKNSKLAFGLGFNYSKTASVPEFTEKYYEIMPQVLFRRIGTTGLYAGAEVGIAFKTIESTLLNLSTSYSTFAMGLIFGYDFFTSDNFSIGPELRLDHHLSSSLKNIAGNTIDMKGSSTFRFLISGTYHL